MTQYLGPCSAYRSSIIQESSVGSRSVRAGRFRANYALSVTQHRILCDLALFYAEDETVSQLLLPLCDGAAQPAVSLRMIDWLVTNYSKKHNIVCVTDKGDVFNIFQGYKLALQRYRRRNFDPFKRRMRIQFELSDEEYNTTVGQANFVRWAHDNGVLRFAQKNASAIIRDMNRCHSEKQTRSRPRGQKRKELSKFPNRRCAIYTVDTTVVLEP